jgi:HAD superfamily hydrolase (TIGR01548 family)
VASVREERRRLFDLLAELGTEPLPSQANFVTTRCRDSRWMRDAMAGLGIGVRYFADRPGLETSVRVTCPGDAATYERLEAALRTVLRPEAILLDMDGVLADVSGSYRQCVLRTAAHFGMTVTNDQVTAAKAAGDANNDWIVTHRLLAEHGVDVPLEDITRVFQDLYQGTDTTAGLRDTERMLMSRETLQRLREVGPLAVVTGRPRKDMEYFLDLHDLAELIPVTVCMEDAPSKPDPTGVRLAMQRLGVRHAWMLGDTPDDIRAARGAGVLPLGVVAPGDDFDTLADALYAAGGARVWTEPDCIQEILP